MKHVGIYGGTFDPIHIGHLITARIVKELRNLSEIIFVPASISPLKQDIKSTLAQHRLEMTKLAINKYEDFSVSDFEINNKGISYTINTLKYFKTLYDKVELIIGYDNYLVFDKWYKWEEILDLANVIVLKRISDAKSDHKIKSEKLIFLETPTIQITSTSIRERNINNLPIDFFVPENVNKYIIENNLYKKNEF